MDRDEELRRRRGEHTRSYSQDKPIGSGENYEAIKRGIKQWLPDLIAAPADMADLAVTGAKKVLQGQKQQTVVPSGYGSTVRGALNRVQPRQQAEMTETPETNWFEEGTRMLNPLFFANPKNALNPLGALAAISSAPSSQLSIVKPRGGNWFTGSGSKLESTIKSLMKGPAYNLDELKKVGSVLPEEYALNKWLEGPLTKYIKRDLATESDPVRKLLEGDRPVSHVNLNDLLNTARENWVSQEALQKREAAGLPRAGVGKSGYGQAWEAISDAFTRNNPAGEVFRDYSRFDLSHPMSQEWVSRLPEDTPIYDFAGDEASDFLGLPHLRDELWNAVREDSDLPTRLKLKPEDFQQMGIEKAIRHVAAINDWRDASKTEAAQEMLLGPGVKLVREYAENNPKGLRWVELAPTEVSEYAPTVGQTSKGTWALLDESGMLKGRDYPTQAEAVQALKTQEQKSKLAQQLKYEGDTMGHCVGGYCDDVMSGNTKIFSLRDAKGEPHVTIEVAPPTSTGASWNDYAIRRMDPDEFEAMRQASMPKDSDVPDLELFRSKVEAHPGYQEWMANRPPTVLQVKGKQNKAPKEDYLPFVQDFLKNPYHGGSWDPDIGDLDYTGLVNTSKGLFTDNEAYKMLSDPKHKELLPDILPALEYMYNDPKYPDYTKAFDEHHKLQGYAQGGLVGKQDFNGVVGYILD